jgi:hypothetical protein
MLRLTTPTTWHLLFWRGCNRAQEGYARGTGPVGQPLSEDIDISDFTQYAGARVIEAPAGTDDENFTEVLSVERAIGLQDDAPLDVRCAAEVSAYRARGARIGVVTSSGTIEWEA